MNATAANWIAGVTFGALILVVGHLADRDLHDAGAISALEADAAEAEARLNHSATTLCQAELGPSAQALWTIDGDLVCRPAAITAEAAR